MSKFTSEQGNLQLRLVLYGSKVSRSLPLPTRILKGLYRTLTEFSSVFILDDLNNTWFSQGYICENSSFFGEQGRGRGETTLFALLWCNWQFWGQLAVTSS